MVLGLYYRANWSQLSAIVPPKAMASQPHFQELMSVEPDRATNEKFWEDNAAVCNEFVREYAPDISTFIPDFLHQFEEKTGVRIPRDGNVLDVGCGTGNRDVVGC